MYKYLVHLNCRFHHRVVRKQMFLVRKLSLTTQVVSGRFLLLVSLSGLSLSMGRVIIVVSRLSSSPHPSSHLLQQSLPAPRCEATLMTSVTRTLLGHWDTALGAGASVSPCQNLTLTYILLLQEMIMKNDIYGWRPMSKLHYAYIQTYLHKSFLLRFYHKRGNCTQNCFSL